MSNPHKTSGRFENEETVGFVKWKDDGIFSYLKKRGKMSKFDVVLPP